MPTFEIVIQRKIDAGWPVAAVQARASDFLPVRSEGMLHLDLDGLRACALPKEYGTALGRALFQEELRDAFTGALASARTGGEALRVLLTVEDVDLKALHWERLCAPFDGGWDFLSLQQQTPFSLYLPSLTDRRFPAIGRRDLRALLLVAGPRDLSGEYHLPDFDTAGTTRAMQDALAASGIPCDVLAAVEGAVGAPGLDSLCEKLTEGSYTLLHVVCHARFHAQSGETHLYLPGDGGKPITASQLIERLKRVHGARGLPHFAFLMTCESAPPQAETGFGGLGQRLVRELGMPAVLAMTGPVTILTANALARGFYARLRESGEPDRALGEALAGMMGRADVTVPAVFSRLGGRALFSEALDRPLTPAEIGYGLDCLIGLAAVRAPALQPQVAALSAKLRGLTSAEGLSDTAARERAGLLGEANGLCEEILDLSFNALALGQPAPPYDARCPFRGLAAFRAEDSAFFFGRESLVQVLLRRLAEHPFLAVLGASGTGKSSLVLAGLLPRLEKGIPAVFSPGGGPLARLEAGLASSTADALVIVDQFEELFTLCRSEDERKEFIRRLLALAPARRVILTMRADFLGECAPYPDLKQALQQHAELVPPMTPAEMRRAIELQAAAVGLRFEAGLAETILDDVQSEPGAMPLLQHALLLLWQRRRGRWLRASAYRETGGVRAAIANTADAIYTALSEPERERMRAIFLRLTRLDADAAPGIELRDTRRRVELDELIPAGGERLLTVDLVRRLANARLVTTGANPLNGKEEVEVAHEALIRHWPRLRSWLDEDRTSLRLAQGVRDASEEWQQASKDTSLLVHRAGRLEDALELSESGRYLFNQAELEYLRACREQQAQALQEKERGRKARERLRNALLALSIAAAAVMASLAVWGGLSSMNASRQAKIAVAAQREAMIQAATAEAERARAEEQVNISLARQLAAQASDLLSKGSFVPRAMLLAIESLNRSPESAAAQALRQGLAVHNTAAASMAHADDVMRVAFSPAGDWVVSASRDGTARVWQAATGKEISRMTHNGQVYCAAFSPDGQWVVSGSEDGSAQVWEAATGKEISRVTHDGYVASVAFSPDGKWVVSGSVDGTAIVWVAATGKEISRLTHGDLVNEVAFNANGRWVVTASWDFTARVWEAATGREIARMTHDYPVNTVAISEDSRRVVSGSEDKTARVWEAATGEEIARVVHDSVVQSVAFSPDGRRVVSGGLDNTARVWQAATGEEITRVIHDGYVVVVAFSPDGQEVLSGSIDSTARVWDADTGAEITRITHGFSVTSAAFSPDGRWAVSGGEDDIARAWQVAGGGEILSLQQRGWVHEVSFSPDGKWVVSAGEDGTARLWEAATGKQLARLNHDGPVTTVAFSPDGRYILTGSEDYTARLWEAATGSEIRRITHGHPVRSVAFSPDSRRFITGSGDSAAWVRETSTGNEVAKIDSVIYWFAFSPDGQWLITGSPRVHPGRENKGIAQVWESATGKIIAEINPLDTVSVVAFHPDGRRVATGDFSGIIQVWEAASGKELARMNHDGSVRCLAFSPDGKWVVSGSWDNTVRVWDAASGQEIARMRHDSWIDSAAFSPDGKWVVSGSDDSTARVWEAATGREINRMTHQGGVSSVVFSPDGKWVASGSFDNTVQVWLWPPEALVERACARLERNLTQAEWVQYLGDGVPYRRTCSNLPEGE